MLIAEILLTVAVVLVLFYMLKYTWFQKACDRFEINPAKWQDPLTLPWWYVGDTCRYRRRK